MHSRAHLVRALISNVNQMNRTLPLLFISSIQKSLHDPSANPNPNQLQFPKPNPNPNPTYILYVTNTVTEFEPDRKR